MHGCPDVGGGLKPSIFPTVVCGRVRAAHRATGSATAQGAFRFGVGRAAVGVRPRAASCGREKKDQTGGSSQGPPLGVDYGHRPWLAGSLSNRKLVRKWPLKARI